MKKRKNVVIPAIILVVILAVGVLLWWFLSRESHDASENDVYVDSVGMLIGTDLGADSRYSGVVEAQKTLDLEADSGKTVKEIYVEAGQEVKTGDPLFCYDVDELNLKLQQAKLEAEGIQNQVNTLNNQITALSAEKNSAPASEQLSYSLQIQSLQLDVRTQEYNFSAKQAEIGQLEKSIENAVVVSEMDGTVKAVNEPASGTDLYGEPKPLISILSNGNYQIKCKVSELAIGSLSEGMEMTIISRVNPEDTWRGVIKKIDRDNRAENPDNGVSYGNEDTMTQATSYYFYVELDSFEGLMLGQHVYVTAGSDEKEADGLWLPESYLVEYDGESGIVWAEDSRGRIERRQVTLGGYDQEMMQYEILDGLTSEDYIAFPSEDITEGAATVHYSDSFLDGGVAE